MADPLYVLLQRAIADDGPEGTVAWEMFKKRAKGTPGTIFFYNEDFSNPLMFVLQRRDAEIEELTKEVAFLRKSFENAGIAPKKMKVKSFPWEKYPELEFRAFEMRFKEGRSQREVYDYIAQHAPEAHDNTTFINQRFVQGRPSLRFGIEVRHGDGKIDWAELWQIGCKEHAADWIQRVMTEGEGWARFQKDGNVPKDWNRLDPNKYITPRGRKKLRDMYHNGGFQSAAKEVETHVSNSGKDGISRNELKTMGVSGRRISDLEKQNVIFTAGDKLVHYSFAAHYPFIEAAKVAALKFSSVAGHG